MQRMATLLLKESVASEGSVLVVGSGVDPEKASQASQAIDSYLTILAPEQEETLLREAGFCDVELFYAGFAFRGWIAVRPSADRFRGND